MDATAALPTTVDRGESEDTESPPDDPGDLALDPFDELCFFDVVVAFCSDFDFFPLPRSSCTLTMSGDELYKQDNHRIIIITYARKLFSVTSVSIDLPKLSSYVTEHV
jgi:hypothetical protein